MVFYVLHQHQSIHLNICSRYIFMFSNVYYIYFKANDLFFIYNLSSFHYRNDPEFHLICITSFIDNAEISTMSIFIYHNLIIDT